MHHRSYLALGTTNRAWEVETLGAFPATTRILQMSHFLLQARALSFDKNIDGQRGEVTRMRIGNTNLKQIGVDAAGQPKKASPIQAGDEVSPTKDSADAGGYSPSAEVVQFTTLAKQVPEIRTEVVRQ